MTEIVNEDELYVEDRDGIDIQTIFSALISHLWLIVIAALVGALAGFIYSAHMKTPMYRTYTTVYVLDKNTADTVTTSALTAGQQLTGDYAQIIKSHTVCSMVIEELGLKMSPSQLAGMVSVSTESDETRVLRIAVSSSSPAMAQKIANSIRVVASDYLMRVMELPNINLIDEAELPVRPYKPDVRKTVIWAAVVTLLIACALIVIKTLLDDTIKTEDDVKRRLGLSVLGMVPDLQTANHGAKKKRGISKYANRLSILMQRRSHRMR